MRMAALTAELFVIKNLRGEIGKNLKGFEYSISHLNSSLQSLLKVALQNRRGLNLLLIKETRFCAALKEECCFSTDHTGMVDYSLNKLRDWLESRQKEGEEGRTWLKIGLICLLGLLPFLSVLAGPLVFSCFSYSWPLYY